MRLNRYLWLLLPATALALLFYWKKNPDQPIFFTLQSKIASVDLDKEEEDDEAKFSEERMRHEFEMLRNPVTNTIPLDIRNIEDQAADKIPYKQNSAFARTLNNSVMVNNAYSSAGPNNIAGRSRTIGIDRRNSSIMLTGGVTGGIFRSTNGGSDWTFVSPAADIRSVTSIVQDPTAPDTWYCGTGELWHGLGAQDIAGTVGFGIFKSINNGQSWTKLSATVGTTSEHMFDSPFDMVHRLAVHPSTGHVYAAVHRRIMRSTDGGNSWIEVQSTSTLSSGQGGLTDVLIQPVAPFKIFTAFTGLNPDRNLAGLWESTTGNIGSFVRIAGGVSGAADSVAGWRSYGRWSRMVMALNGTSNRLYVLYKNDQSADGPNPRPEADLFRAEIGSGTAPNYTWTNFSDFVPDEPNFNFAGVDPYTTQFLGFNMSIAVKPDNDNFLFLGGTVVHRVDLSQSNPAQRFRRIGGYGVGFFPQQELFIYRGHHPDCHFIQFVPGSNTQLYTATDGGIYRTSNSVLADTVEWTDLNAGLQTIQYQFVNITPDLRLNWTIGGTQDNGTTVNLDATNGQNHIGYAGGDGCSVAMTALRPATGNELNQEWYFSIVNGGIRRSNFTWSLSNNNLNFVRNPTSDITPKGLAGQGQWLTLFLNDPDFSEDLYYNNGKRLFRTNNASRVTDSTWTEITGVSTTLTGTEEFSSMALSKRNNGIKYLYFGTDAGRLYRLDNAKSAAATSTPVSITPTGMRAGSYVAGVAVNPRNADTVIAVVSNYDVINTNGNNVIVNNIFWTGNATSANPTWQIIDGALAPLSSQSCAIVVTTSGVEYYVGTSVGLYSTTSINGANTQWLNEAGGQPMMQRAIIRSLVNRQQDNTLVVGTHGNGMFIAQIGNAVTINDVATSVFNPIINSRSFIENVYPTITANQVQYRIGNQPGIRNIRVEVFDQRGARVYFENRGYQNAAVNIRGLSGGTYILQITSADGRYRHIQKIIRQ